MKNENQHFSADRRKFGRHFWIGAAVAGALSAAVIFTAASAVYRKNRFDLKIGEEKVGSKEYQLCMDLVKYDVKMEIQKRYDALYGEDFWEQSYAVDRALAPGSIEALAPSRGLHRRHKGAVYN